MKGVITIVVGIGLMIGAAWLAILILGVLGIHVYWPSWLPSWIPH